MLNAFIDLLCSKLCWHNRPGPNGDTGELCYNKITTAAVVTTESDCCTRKLYLHKIKCWWLLCLSKGKNEKINIHTLLF